MNLLIAAASDLAPLELDFLKLAGVPCRFTFGASGMLARQIANGAPYDVFLSADEKYAPGGRVYALGRLGLWARNQQIRTLADLQNPLVRWIALANPDHAPYGRAARQALERSGHWPRLERRIVLAENVRQAFQFAESGNADACLVSWSLIAKRGGHQLDAALHDPLRQTALVVKGTAQGAAARAFVDKLVSPAGQALLRAAGFEIP